MSVFRFYNVAFVLGVTLLGISAPQASNLSFLKDTPMANFNDEDVRLMKESVEAVLVDTKTPSSREWKNDATNHSGTAATLIAFAGPEGIACKRLRLTNHTGSRDGKATYTLCNVGADGWKLVSNDYAPVPKTPPPAANK